MTSSFTTCTISLKSMHCTLEIQHKILQRWIYHDFLYIFFYNTRHKSSNTLCDFPLPKCWLGYWNHLSAPKICMAQHWGRRGAHLSENEGVKSECKKFGENSREMASVSTICDEYCSCLWGRIRKSICKFVCLLPTNPTTTSIEGTLLFKGKLLQSRGCPLDSGSTVLIYRSLSNNDVIFRWFKLNCAYSISFSSSNGGNFFWSWILKDWIKVQKRKIKSRSPQNMKLSIFTL